MKNKIVSALLLGFLAACSSTKTINGVKYEKDEILSTAGDKSMPDWAEEGELKPFIIKDGKVYSVGITTLRGDERPEAGLRAAESLSRGNYSRHIENRMEFIFQGAEENFGFDSVQAKYIGSEVSSLTANSISVEGHWYKRYAQTQEDGSRRIFYKAYALTTMTESDLKRAVFAAINKGISRNKLSQDFKAQVSGQWSRFVEGQPEDRQPSSEESKDSE